MAAKGTTTKAKAKSAGAASDQTKENGASAPVSLAPGATGDASNGGDGKQAGGGDESGSGNPPVDGGTGSLAGGDGAADQGGGPVPGAGNAGDPGDSAAAGGIGDAGGGAAGDAGSGNSGGLAVGQASALSNEGGSDAGNSTAGAAAGGSVAVLADPQEVARAAGNTLQASGIGEALLALLEDGENAQTPAEWASVAPVTSAAWSFPQIQRFPARITLKNNTPSRVVVLGVRLEPYTELSADLYEDSHARLEKYLTSHARLGGWDHSIGVQVTHDSED